LNAIEEGGDAYLREMTLILTLSDVVLACCVLHIFCEIYRGHYLEKWDCPQDCVEKPVVDNRVDSQCICLQ